MPYAWNSRHPPQGWCRFRCSLVPLSLRPPCAIRKGKKECCTFLVIADSPHMTMMGLCRFPNYRKPDASAENCILQVRCPIKALKDSLAILDSNQWSKVVHRYEYLGMTLTGRNLNGSARCGIFSRIVDVLCQDHP